MERILNWQPSPDDSRDLHFGIEKPKGIKLPSFGDLTDLMPEIWDQGNAGSCTGHGGARVLKYGMNKAKIEFGNVSRLFAYYTARQNEGTTETDAGAFIRDILRGANQYGFVDEKLWPYDISKLTVRPPKDVYEAAKPKRIHIYAKVNLQDIDAVRLCITHGYPVIYGTWVYRSFMEYKGGILKMPGRWERNMGGHCMVLSGYDDSTDSYLDDNSWGTGWGEHGRARIPYDYIRKYASDGWMIRFI